MPHPHNYRRTAGSVLFCKASAYFAQAELGAPVYPRRSPSVQRRAALQPIAEKRRARSCSRNASVMWSMNTRVLAGISFWLRK